MSEASIELFELRKIQNPKFLRGILNGDFVLADSDKPHNLRLLARATKNKGTERFLTPREYEDMFPNAQKLKVVSYPPSWAPCTEVSLFSEKRGGNHRNFRGLVLNTTVDVEPVIIRVDFERDGAAILSGSGIEPVWVNKKTNSELLQQEIAVVAQNFFNTAISLSTPMIPVIE